MELIVAKYWKYIAVVILTSVMGLALYIQNVTIKDLRASLLTSETQLASLKDATTYQNEQIAKWKKEAAHQASMVAEAKAAAAKIGSIGKQQAKHEATSGTITKSTVIPPAIVNTPEGDYYGRCRDAIRYLVEGTNP